MSETTNRRAWYEQIIQETKGMTQKERRAYYDAHPGSEQVMREFIRKPPPEEDDDGLLDAAVAHDLVNAVNAINETTQELSPAQYASWLEEHPVEARLLNKINKHRLHLSTSQGDQPEN